MLNENKKSLEVRISELHKTSPVNDNKKYSWENLQNDLSNLRAELKKSTVTIKAPNVVWEHKLNLPQGNLIYFDKSSEAGYIKYKVGNTHIDYIDNVEYKKCKRKQYILNLLDLT